MILEKIWATRGLIVVLSRVQIDGYSSINPPPDQEASPNLLLSDSEAQLAVVAPSGSPYRFINSLHNHIESITNEL